MLSNQPNVDKKTEKPIKVSKFRVTMCLDFIKTRADIKSIILQFTFIEEFFIGKSSNSSLQTK